MPHASLFLLCTHANNVHRNIYSHYARFDHTRAFSHNCSVYFLSCFTSITFIGGLADSVNSNMVIFLAKHNDSKNGILPLVLMNL